MTSEPPVNRVTRKRGRSSGFTLIELIMASTLVAIVAVGLFASLHVAMDARDAADRAVEPGRTSDLAFDVIRHDLEDAAPPTGTLAKEFTGTDGQDDRGRDGDYLVFYTAAPGPQHVDGDGEIRRVQYFVLAPDGTDGEHVLVRRVAHNLMSPQEPTVFDDEVVLRGVAGFGLRYYDGTDWVDDWDSTQYNGMPTLVEVSIDLERPSKDPNQPATIKRYTRLVQVPCAVAQQSNVTGL